MLFDKYVQTPLILGTFLAKSYVTLISIVLKMIYLYTMFILDIIKVNKPVKFALNFFIDNRKASINTISKLFSLLTGCESENPAFHQHAFGC